MGKSDWDVEEARWAQQIEAVVGKVRAWRAAHPRATFREITEAIDAELNPLRADGVRGGGQQSGGLVHGATA